MIRLITNRAENPDQDILFLGGSGYLSCCCCLPCNHCSNWNSDMDPDPVGSAFIWVRGIKLREKQRLTNKYSDFLYAIIYFKSETAKKVVYL